MMLSSDSAAIVVEGMPGAGKTTVLAALALAGHTVLGEYTTEAGTVLRQHPPHDEDVAHLANWLRKNSQLSLYAGSVWVDRDWLTALAWSASTSGLAERSTWVHDNLVEGRLALPQRWIILDVPPDVSLQRRAPRLQAEHPWSQAAILERLRRFYLDPVATLGHAHPRLAELVARVPRVLVDATAEPCGLARAVEDAGAR